MKSTEQIELARIIRDAIERDGRSLYAIAKAADVTYQALHPWMRGHREDIALSTADRLCKVLGLTLRPAKRRKGK
jgi:transposase-like protein